MNILHIKMLSDETFTLTFTLSQREVEKFNIFTLLPYIPYNIEVSHNVYYQDYIEQIIGRLLEKYDICSIQQFIDLFVYNVNTQVDDKSIRIGIFYDRIQALPLYMQYVSECKTNNTNILSYDDWYLQKLDLSMFDSDNLSELVFYFGDKWLGIYNHEMSIDMNEAEFNILLQLISEAIDSGGVV